MNRPIATPMASHIATHIATALAVGSRSERAPHLMPPAPRLKPGLSVSRGIRGFSLVEIMIAMGIFAVGFIAVAAMFPAAIILQRETMTDVEAQLIARNATSIIGARTLTYSTSVAADLTDTLPAVLVDLTPFSQLGGSLATRFTLGDRGYPTAEANVNDRKFYWVPFIRRLQTPATGPGDFIIAALVLSRDPARDYTFSGGAYGTPAVTIPGNPVCANDASNNAIPKVIGVDYTYDNTTSPTKILFNNRLFTTVTLAGQPDQIRPGDWFMDDTGTLYLAGPGTDSAGVKPVGAVVKSTATTKKLWYAPPPGAGLLSPCQRGVLLAGTIKQLP